VLDARVHRAQIGLLATFIALVIFMILALDRPYRGDLGLQADAVRDRLRALMAG
jgi:hypothetical protein